MTADCKTLQPALERRLLGEASAGDLAALAAHCVECAECRALCTTDSSLMEFASSAVATDAELAAVRVAVLRQARIDAAAPPRTRWWSLPPLRLAIAGAAALALFVVGALVGRAGSGGALARDPLARELQRAALARTTAHDALESPFTYANVSVEPGASGRLRLEFDVSTHVVVERPTNDPLVGEVVAQTLLAGASPLAGKLQAIAVADRVLDSRVRDALAESAENDPSAVVRLKAFAELADRPGGDDGDQRTSHVALRLLTNERSVELRLAAIDYLTGNHVDRAALRRALDAADPATRGPLLVRASQYLQTN
jgi:hypothetical protein